jgi:hypothetical protein
VVTLPAGHVERPQAVGAHVGEVHRLDRIADAGLFISDTIGRRMRTRRQECLRSRGRNRPRALIIDEWDKWVIGKIPKGEKGTDMQGLEFHGYLGREKPLLLEFKYAGNRWQQVKVWLREAERISR